MNVCEVRDSLQLFAEQSDAKVCTLHTYGDSLLAMCHLVDWCTLHTNTNPSRLVVVSTAVWWWVKTENHVQQHHRGGSASVCVVDKRHSI